MGRSLRFLGLAVLAATAALLTAETLGWIAPGSMNAWYLAGTKIGLILLAVGVVLGLLEPMRRQLNKGRCVRCHAPTERGHRYCLDHLQETLNEYRDQTRSGMLRRPGPRT